MKTEIKKVNSLEECVLIKSKEIVGVGQAGTETIPARCLSNDGEKLKLIGNMDDEVIVKYNFLIKEIEGFYDDGSIRAKMDNAEFIEKQDKRYPIYKRFYEGGQN